MSALSVIIGTKKGNKRAVDFVFVMCILHNILLSLNDEWEPTEEELIEMMNNSEDVYHSLMRSRWAREIEDNQGAVAAMKRAGMLKRQWLTNTVIDWLIDHDRIS